MAGTCLVFGAAGFIGAAVATELLADGWRVRGFDRRGRQIPASLAGVGEFTWIQGDFQSVPDLEAALEGVDAVVHLICTSLPKNSNLDPLRDVEGNVLATLRLLLAMVEKNVKRIVFASSGGTVYGVPHCVPIREDHATQPQVSYGITKLAIEKYLNLFAQLHGLKPISLRIANPYGEGQRVGTAQGVVAAFLHGALRDEPVEIWGDGTVTRDYIHVKDVARAFLCALRYNGDHQVFNIGSGRGYSLNELLALIEAHTGRPMSRHYLPGRSFDVPVSVLDSSLARTELAWAPTIPLADGLRMTLASLAP